MIGISNMDENAGENENGLHLLSRPQIKRAVARVPNWRPSWRGGIASTPWARPKKNLDWWTFDLNRGANEPPDQLERRIFSRACVEPIRTSFLILGVSKLRVLSFFFLKRSWALGSFKNKTIEHVVYTPQGAM